MTLRVPASSFTCKAVAAEKISLRKSGITRVPAVQTTVINTAKNSSAPSGRTKTPKYEICFCLASIAFSLVGANCEVELDV